MATITYLNFDLHIERTAAGYRAQVLGLPASEASADFTLPFLGLEPPEIETTRALGGCLWLCLADIPTPADLLWQYLYNPILNCILSLSRAPPRAPSKSAAAWHS